MKQWWVYELVAGRWRYIGMTTNLKRRLGYHRDAIAKHTEKPRTENWHQPLEEFPNPDDWEMRVLRGPFETEDEAIAEEERLQRDDWDNPGRIWEKCGNTLSAETKAKLSEANSGENHPNFGKTHSAETKDKIAAALSGQALSDEHREKLSAANRGKTFSAEHKVKLSEANRRRHARRRAAKAKQAAGV